MYVWIPLSQGLVRRNGGFRGYRGGEEPSTKPSVHVELEAHRRATPRFAGAYFFGETLCYSSLSF